MGTNYTEKKLYCQKKKNESKNLGINLCRAPNSLKFLASRNLTTILLLIQTIFGKDKSHTHTHTPHRLVPAYMWGKGRGRGRRRCFLRRGELNAS